MDTASASSPSSPSRPLLSPDDLIVGHLGLARSLSRRYLNRGESAEDLEGVAYLALVRAAQRFDADRQVSFSTYAMPCVLGELKRHLRDRAWSVRTPRRVHDLYLQVAEARETLGHRLGRSPAIPEVASYLGQDEEAVIEAMDATSALRAASLDAPRSADGSTVADLLGGEDPMLSIGLDRIELGRAAAALSDLERMLLVGYFFDGRTQADLARELNVSQMQVSRLLSRALVHLRQRMTR